MCFKITEMFEAFKRNFISTKFKHAIVLTLSKIILKSFDILHLFIN